MPYGAVINRGTVGYLYGYLFHTTYNSTYSVVQELQLQVAKSTNRKSFIFTKETKHLCRKLSVKVGGALNALLMLPLKLRPSADLLPKRVSWLVNGSNAELYLLPPEHHVVKMPGIELISWLWRRWWCWCCSWWCCCR